MWTRPWFHKVTRFGFICLIFFTLLPGGRAFSADVKIQWAPNDPAPQGYRVYARQGDQPYRYNQPVWEGDATACSITDLRDRADYYFVVRAYAGELESPDSKEVHYRSNDSFRGDNGAAFTDSDADGMPDVWESRFGLDAQVDDAHGDVDQDGILNHDEFLAGLEPDDPGQASAPAPPEAVRPAAAAVVSCNPLLEVGRYRDSEGDAHIATQWQLFDVATGECLLDVVSAHRLTRLRVPMLLLDGDATYRWHARFFDSGGKASAWSAAGEFNTQKAENDLNRDGIPDDLESGRTDGDGLHAFESSVDAMAPLGMVIEAGDSGATLEKATLVQPHTFEIDATTPAHKPASMVAYKLVLEEPGQQARVVVHLPDPAPAGAAWLKYDAVNGWQDYTHHVVFATDRRSVTVFLQDGGHGDADGAVNGVIVDPSGLAAPAEASAADDAPVKGGARSLPDGGGGGCFLTDML
jgi:hypothetical protein